MKRIKKLFSLFPLFLVGILAGSLLVACGSVSHKAPVEDRQLRANQAGPAAANSTTDESQSTYMVKKGDTLYRIAMEKGQSYTDLIKWNNLANPHDIKVGQVLKVVPPGTVGTSAIASSSVEVRPLGSAATSSSSSAVSPPSSNNKHGPRADKRPYSELALAELQKNDPGDVATGKVSVEKTTEKLPPPVLAQVPAAADAIVWTWPVEGKVATNFDGGKTKGVDFLGKQGQNVYAAAAGTVMYAGGGIRGYGNLVIIKHANNFLSAYAHNQSILVKEKQVVSKGQKIAEMGNSDSDVVKLHFEIRQQGKPVDPTKFLPAR